MNGLGYVMITRLDPPQALLQGIWTAVGVAAYIFTLLVVRRTEILDKYRYLFALLGLGLLVLPLAPGIGENINGARLWVHFGPLSFQPVELAKLALAVFFASYFIEKQDMLSGGMGASGRKMDAAGNYERIPAVVGLSVQATLQQMATESARKEFGPAL